MSVVCGTMWMRMAPFVHELSAKTMAITQRLRWASAVRVDPDVRQEPWRFPMKEIRSGIRRRKTELGPNRVVEQLERCALERALDELAALVELESPGKAIAVLGHMDEMGPDAPDIHRRVGTELAASGVAALVAVGPQAEPFRTGFDAAGGSGHYCATREEAAILLARISAPGDRLLIKGSRSAAMEELLPLLEDSFQSH